MRKQKTMENNEKDEKDEKDEKNEGEGEEKGDKDTVEKTKVSKGMLQMVLRKLLSSLRLKRWGAKYSKLVKRNMMLRRLAWWRKGAFERV
jgi:hypothetical protein